MPWVNDSGEPKKLSIRWGPDPPIGWGTFKGDDVKIFPRTIEHRSSWLWRWVFPACCWPACWLACHRNSRKSR